MRSLTTTLVAAGLLVAVAEGYIDGFPNLFPGFPEVTYIKPLPLPKPPRLPFPFQPPPLPEPPLIPVFGNPGIPSFGSLFPFPPPGSIEVTPGDGSFSGFSVSSVNNGKDGFTIVKVNDNGKTQTYISPSTGTGEGFIGIPPSSRSSPALHFAEMMRKIMRSAFGGFSRIPEYVKPEFPKIKPIKIKPIKIEPIKIKPIKFKPMEFDPIDFNSDFDPIDFESGPSSSGTFKAQVVGSTFHMSSKNGDKPKIYSEVHSIVNDNGKVKQKHLKYEN